MTEPGESKAQATSIQRRPGAAVSSSGVFQGLKHPVKADDLISWTISSTHSMSKRGRLQGLWHLVVQIGNHAILKKNSRSSEKRQLLVFYYTCVVRAAAVGRVHESPKGRWLLREPVSCKTPTHPLCTRMCAPSVLGIARGMRANGVVGNFVSTHCTQIHPLM